LRIIIRPVTVNSSIRYCLVGMFILMSGFWPQQPVYATTVYFHQGFGGVARSITVKKGDSLIELARSHDLGYNEIIEANPGIDPFVPVEGTLVTIPAAWLLPDVPKRQGIVINLAEMRLYHFYSRKSERVETFPVGIGDEGWDTPTGTFRIVQKIVNPAWHVPKSIQKQRPELPKIVPPGPDNPLGTHALRLSNGKILIHGTGRPFGIGRKVSHGCLHLYPEDIVRLYGEVKLGTRVTIIRQPVKATAVNGRVFVEIHGDEGRKLEQEAINLLVRKHLFARVDVDRLKAALSAKSGKPTDITRK
jgi:L,D-transpeptidase ErfK/SrfK